jgi:hypothetical protein
MTTKIVSWDVGIRNLAYCNLCLDHTTTAISIINTNWGIVNLIEEHLCQTLNNKNNICNAPAKFTSIDKQNKINYYCGTHKQQTDVTEITLPSITTSQTCHCTKPATHDNNGVFLCKTHTKQAIAKRLKEVQLKPLKKTKCKGVNLEDLAITMYDKLDKISCLQSADEVIIENQPSLKNPLMKTIASILFSYFIMKKIKVKFICPSNKLKVDDNNALSVIKKTEDNKKYKMTKELSVTYTKKLLDGNNTLLEHLNSHKKKDDLCDAYLQGYYYLTKKVVTQTKREAAT